MTTKKYLDFPYHEISKHLKDWDHMNFCLTVGIEVDFSRISQAFAEQNIIRLYKAVDFTKIRDVLNWRLITFYLLHSFKIHDEKQFIEIYQDHLDWSMISAYVPLQQNLIRKFKDKVDWKLISSGQSLSEKFIKEFKAYVDWKIISQRGIASEGFISEFQDLVSWSDICSSRALSQQFLRDHTDKLDWFQVSANQKLSEEFIRDFRNHVDWECISEKQKLSEGLIEESVDYVDWSHISRKQILSETFLRKYSYRLDWVEISAHQKLSEGFIREFVDCLDFWNISHGQKLSEDFIGEFKDHLDWSGIGTKQKLSEGFIRKYKDKLDWMQVSRLSILSEEFIREFKDYVHWKTISQHQKLSEDFITELKDLLDWHLIARKQKCSKEFIRDNIPTEISSSSKTRLYKIFIKRKVENGAILSAASSSGTPNRDKTKYINYSQLRDNLSKIDWDNLLVKEAQIEDSCNEFIKIIQKETKKVTKMNLNDTQMMMSRNQDAQYYNFKLYKAKSNLNHNISPETFNNYFISIGQHLAEKIQVTPEGRIEMLNNIRTPNKTCSLLSTTVEEVSTVIRNLKVKKSHGYDGITAELLKNIASKICLPLCNIYNHCLSQGYFPKCFKKSIVIPIHKRGSFEDINNYRSKLVITNFAKIFEKIIKKKLDNFFVTNNILSPQQFGFMENRNAENAITSLSEFIYSSIDNSKNCMTIFLDLRKAFDTIDPQLLVRKLELLGLRDKVLSLCKSFLSDRNQSVYLENDISSEQVATYGIPEGSVLSPLFFLLYLNDLFYMPLKGKLISYVDDMALVVEGSTWDETKHLAEIDLQKIKNWLDVNRLTLNYKKSQFLNFTINSRNSPDFNMLKIHGKNCSTLNNCSCLVIKSTSSVEYLGYTIDGAVISTTLS